MKKVVFLLLIMSAIGLQAQDWEQAPDITWSGFVDVYYAYDFNKPNTGIRQDFLYNHNRHNEFNLNLALVRMNLTHDRYRANLALQSGTYATDNYAAEDDVFKNVFEANAGLALNTKGTLWLDAGIFGSHLGFESAVSMDNPTLTRSLVAENSPYFLSGAKLTYTASDKVEVTAVVANGWQRIKRVPGNSALSYGTQLTVNPSESVTINWSTFITTEDADDARRMMYFSNLYSLLELSSKLRLIAGFDLGMRQVAPESNVTESWMAPVGIVQYQMDEKHAMAFRAEYYNDPSGVIISESAAGSFRCTGISANFDYLPTSNVACRVEGRWFQNKDPYFLRGNELVKGNFMLVGSIAIKINQTE